MKTLTFNTQRELKQFTSKNRRDVTNINGVEFGEIYPSLEVTNNNASYYSVKKQGNEYLTAPFKVSAK